MMPLSEFLNARKSRIVQFIEDVSSVSELAVPIGDACNSAELMRAGFEQTSCKYLAILHRILSSFVPQIKFYIANSKTVKGPSNCAKSTSSSSSSSCAISSSNDEEEDIEESSERDEDAASLVTEKETSFVTSMQRLVSILEDIDDKVK